MKKSISIFLLIVMIFGIVPAVPIFEQTAYGAEQGIYTYNVSDGEVTITGCESSASGNIVIPAELGGYPVTKIGQSAFEDCTSLTSVTIPNSVISIDYNVFYNCTSLISVSIPGSVTSIGNMAFSNCSKLTLITIPNSVTSIGNETFAGCTDLIAINVDSDNQFYSSQDGVLFDKYITKLIVFPFDKSESYSIPDGVANIGSSAFLGCSELKAVLIPDSVTSIGYNAFKGCDGLLSIIFPGWITSIAQGAFSGCSNLTSIAFSASVTSIADNVFFGCTNLTSIDIPKSVKSIGRRAFFDCRSLTSIVIPSDVTYLDAEAFSNCINLTSVDIPRRVTGIGGAVFRGCSSLTAINVDSSNLSYSSQDGVLFNRAKTELITCPEGKSGLYSIPSSVTIIQYNAFKDCRSLISVVIPSNVTSIKDRSFYGCNSLTDINVENDNAYYSNQDGILFSKDKTKLFVFPGGKNGAYSIPNSVTTIGTGAFYSCSNLASVYIPESVVEIGYEAFYGCSSLVSIDVNINNLYYSSQDGVLFDPPKTMLIAFPAGINGSYSIPNEVTSIREGAFYGCNGLIRVDISDNVIDIDNDVFANCANLILYCEESSYAQIYAERYNIPFVAVDVSGDKKYLTYTVSNAQTTITSCDKSASGDIVIPSKLGGYPVTKIEHGSFTDCTNLTAVDIPSSITQIGIFGGGVFSGCYNLTMINVDKNNGIYSSQDGMLFNKDGTELLTCPEGKSGLVYIPSNVRSVGYYLSPGGYAFLGCRRVTDIDVSIYNQYYSSQDGVLFNKAKTTLVEFPGGKSGPYSVPSSITLLAYGAFFNCTGLTTLTIPSSVTSIGDNTSLSYNGNMFLGCNNLTSINVDSANWAYSSQDGVLFDKSKTEIRTFPEGRGGLYYIPDGVKNIGYEAFKSCKNLISVSLPNSVTSIGERVFGYCENLTTVTIPNSVTSISYNAFDGCSSLAIHGEENSYAQTYAGLYGIPFVVQEPGGGIKHTVTFQNYDGSVLEEREVYNGQTAEYQGVAPTRPAGNGFSYVFLGWNQDLLNVTEDMTVTAQFDAVAYIEIRTEDNLEQIRNNLSGYFVLMNDITLTKPWTPIGGSSIGSNECFAGVFDGNKHVIRNVVIPAVQDYDYEYECAGFFGYMENAVVKNLGLEIQFGGEDDFHSSGTRVGGLAVAARDSVIESCYVEGTIQINAEYFNSIGGLLAEAVHTDIKNCYTSVDIVAKGSYPSVGGLASGLNASTIENCYSNGSITLIDEEDGSYEVGGFVEGEFYINDGKSTIKDCYYNSDKYTYPQNQYAVAKTSDELRELHTFIEWDSALSKYIGWDFDNIWSLDSKINNGYPNLRFVTSELEIVDVKATHNEGVKLLVIDLSLSQYTRGDLIFIGYKNGKFLELYKYELDDLVKEGSFKFYYNQEPDTVKVMLWEDVANMQPLCKDKSIPESQWIDFLK